MITYEKKDLTMAQLTKIKAGVRAKVLIKSKDKTSEAAEAASLKAGE